MWCTKHEIFSVYPEFGACVEFVVPDTVSLRAPRTRMAHGVTRVSALLYADDVVIFSENINELQKILEIYDNTFTRYRLYMSYKKTETMAFNIDEDIKDQKNIVTVSGVAIKNVRQFLY